MIVSMASLIGVGCLPAEDDFEEVSLDFTGVYFEAIGQGHYAEVNDTLEVVIDDSVTWNEYQDMLPTPLPFREVDFEQTRVFVVAFPVSSGGHNVVFESVEESAETIVASYRVGVPGTDCRIIEGMAVPFQAVVVTRTNDTPKEVIFERRSEIDPCTMD